MPFCIRFVVLFLGLLAHSIIQAQQAPIFSHFNQALAEYNPGYYGMGEGICVTGIIRQQWAGSFADSEGNNTSPQDILLTAHTPLRAIHGGIGLSIIQDRLGYDQDIGFRLGYAYHADLVAGTLSIGLALNMMNRSRDFSKFQPAVDDPLLNNLSGEQTGFLFDGNIGLFYQVEDSYFVGIGVLNFLQSKGQELTSGSGNLGYRFMGDRTLSFNLGYFYTLPSYQKLQLQPMFQLLSNLNTTTFNLGMDAEYNNKFKLGVNYRPFDGLSPETLALKVGVNIKEVMVGYAYEINTMGYGINGSHEIMVRYCFKLQLDKTKGSYKNTRYL